MGDTMRKGELNKIVKIYNPTIVINEYGEQIETYSLLSETKAKLIKRKGNIGEIAGQIEYVYPISFIVGYYLEVQRFAVIEYDGQFYFADSILKEEDCIIIDTHQIDSNLVNINEV